MKKNASILIILLYSLVNYAQPFLEDFDTTTPPALPPGWTSHHLFGGNGHPCTGVDDWANIDETVFAGCLADPVTTSAKSAPNFAFIGDVLGAPGDIVEDILFTPLLAGLLDSETYDIKFQLRRTDKSPDMTTTTVMVFIKYLPDVDDDGIAEPGGDDGAPVLISTISLVDGMDEPWTAFSVPWMPPADDDFFIGWQAEWSEAGETGVCLDDIEISGAPPLPVELTLFTASIIREGVLIEWVTETEVNNYGFEVERKVSSKQLAASTWEKIGFVEGHGNSNSPKEYNFLDEGINYGNYAYRLKQIDNDGTFEYSDIIEVNAGIIPEGFVLEQNYPNPFNPTTIIKFAVDESTNATLKIYDILGNEIATLFNEITEAGKVYEIEFTAIGGSLPAGRHGATGRDASGLSSGVYYYRLSTPKKSLVRKMLLLQ